MRPIDLTPRDHHQGGAAHAHHHRAPRWNHPRWTGPWWAAQIEHPASDFAPSVPQGFFHVLWVENARWRRAEAEADLARWPRRVDLLA